MSNPVYAGGRVKKRWPVPDKGAFERKRHARQEMMPRIR